MKNNNRVSSSDQVDQRQIATQARRSPVARSIVIAGLVLGVLAVFLLPVDNRAVAAPPADEPCADCINAAASARYTGLAASYREKAEASRAAYAARYTRLAAFHTRNAKASMAATTARYSDLAASYRKKAEASRAAYAARYTRLAAFYAARTEANTAASTAP